MARELKFDFANMEVATNALLCPNANEFYSKSYINEDIVGNYRTIPGVKYKTKLATTLFDQVLQAENCTWASTDSILDAMDIDVCSLSGMVQICQFDIEKSFLSQWMAKGAQASYDVMGFMSHFWDTMSKEIQAEIELLRWTGLGSGSDPLLKLCEGYISKLREDDDVNKVVGTTSTVDNVIGEMTKVLQKLTVAAPALISKPEDLRLFVAPNIALNYRIAAALGNTMTYITKDLELTFLGIKIVVAQGMPANYMVLTNNTNLIYAFDGENDGKELKAVNLLESVNEPILRTRADVKVGFYYTNPEEIVLYGTVVS